MIPAIAVLYVLVLTPVPGQQRGTLPAPLQQQPPVPQNQATPQLPPTSSGSNYNVGTLYTHRIAYKSPQAYFYNAAANYNLHNIDEAEKSARQAAELDDKHNVPRVHYILGRILIQKHDYSAAAENLRLYLQFSPIAKDEGEVRRQISELDATVRESR